MSSTPALHPTHWLRRRWDIGPRRTLLASRRSREGPDANEPARPDLFTGRRTANRTKEHTMQNQKENGGQKPDRSYDNKKPPSQSEQTQQRVRERVEQTHRNPNGR
jgi:hypothetical protein